MKLFNKYKKYLKFVILFLFICLPFFVFADREEHQKYRLYGNGDSNAFVPKNSTNDGYEASGMCFHNDSPNSYLIPNNTHGEWSSFYNLVIDNNNVTVPGVASIASCCVDGVCNGAETSASCPLDCNVTYTSCPASINISDASGPNTPYGVVKIGSQCWLTKNLNVGTMIDASSQGMTNLTEINRYCYNNDTQNCDIYGGLYSWAGAMRSNPDIKQGLCPTGWHIPSVSDFAYLNEYLGASAGTLLKANSAYWSPNSGTNSSGFSALPGGYSDAGGVFDRQGFGGFMWTSTKNAGISPSSVFLDANTSSFGVDGAIDSNYGYSVRCVRDVLASARYQLAYSTGLGGILIGATSQFVDAGGSGTSVQAGATRGYVFNKWSDNRTDNPRTDTNVNANVSVTASYTASPCSWEMCDVDCTQYCGANYPDPPEGGGGNGYICDLDPCCSGACSSDCAWNCPGGYYQ